MKKTAKKKKRRIESRFALRVGRSRTGLGVFAEEPIKHGMRIVEYTGRTLKPGEEYTSRSKYLFEISPTKTIDGTAKQTAAGYTNHPARTHLPRRDRRAPHLHRLAPAHRAGRGADLQLWQGLFRPAHQGEGLPLPQ